ncbi:MAG: response regulator receiver modulated diguanylate phosphodiesterase [Frankiales bacterium]|nr:response regulator receiver modulated diguanylate phosphodiesterase [Frankiales bacterium]
MTTHPVERPGRWALPPQPPETWVGSTANLVMLFGAALTLALPGLVLLPKAGVATYFLAALYAVGGLLALSSSYLLLVQATVTQDRRLSWTAGGFGMLFVLELVRSLDQAIPGRDATQGQLKLAAALALMWLLVLPMVVLLGGLRHRTHWLLVVPLLVLVGATCAAYQLDLVHTDGVRVTPLARTLVLVAGALALASALWWRTRVPYGNRGAWGWVGGALLLQPVVAVLRGSSLGKHDPTSWASLIVEDVVLLLPAVGLYWLSHKGYLRQARRWRQLESEVRNLRASSALLPGLSITPEDDGGLPEKADVLELLARTDLQVALQPVLELATGATVGQEALARFGGRVPTDRWFRAAALHGLGHELERVTMKAALDTLATLPADQFLAINSSPASLSDEAVLALLHGADLSRVVVEITEHDAVNDYELTRATLGALRRGGARIAVDDVGAGFASLRHVLLLQPDVVKLDTSLTKDVHDSPRQQAIVRALVTFADEVGAVVLGEGIEVAEQVPALVDAGVALGQGWHLGIPVIQQ